jgi:hypothetical protein
MKYALLIYEDETIYGGEDTALYKEIVEAHQSFGGSLGAAMQGGAGLEPTSTATTVRTRGGEKLLHDGPFAETKEQLGGFYLIDVPDLDAAIAIARRLPVAADASIEIRPLIGGG